ncbi:MAG: hypothetical protein JXQ96_23330 [Cyclobacteriaceae bacterium]
MDNSFIELIKVIGNQIDNDELTKAIKEDKFDGEFALSEDGLNLAKKQVSQLLTIESAVANPTVVEMITKDTWMKHKKTALTQVEEKLKPIYDKMGIDYSDAEFISDKIGDIEEKLSEAISKGDNKSVVDSLNKELREAKESLESREQEIENKINEVRNEYAARDLRREYELKANDYQWADVYSNPDLKKAILNQKWEKLNAKAHLKLSEDGNIQVMQKDMPDKELYEGNKIMTFQSLLEPEISDFLKKSSPEKKTKSNEQNQVVQDDLTPKQKEMIAQKEKFQKAS